MKSYDTIIELGAHLEKKEDTLCLLGLGSIEDTERLDQYSDIDFFLIVEKGAKEKYMADLSWTHRPILFSFKNTRDGYKLLFDNDVFAEFAIFEPDELAHIPFDKGNVIFAKPSFDLSLIEPQKKRIKALDVYFNVNEAMTNLYIGLLRDKRGEKASAFTFIQVFACNLVMPLFNEEFKGNKVSTDAYVYERRIEFRHKEAEKILATFKQGYEKNKDSARAILTFLKSNFDVNLAFYHKILALTI